MKTSTANEFTKNVAISSRHILLGSAWRFGDLRGAFGDMRRTLGDLRSVFGGSFGRDDALGLTPAT